MASPAAAGALGVRDDLDRPITIVSCDAHIGPRMEQLRPFCPTHHLDRFDAYAADAASAWRQLTAAFTGRESEAFTRNHRTDGHHDGAARRRDMDLDGVAAEVIFHGSQNGQPIPFQGFTDVATAQAAFDPELAAVGLRIYNRWLAELCAEAPDRHVGLVQLPLWDLGLAIDELDWAVTNGLRGVNFPAPRPELPPYNDPGWEPFWEACAEARMPLCTHAGSGGAGTRYMGPEAEALQALEHGGWFARRGMHWMIFGGVFERHPTLTLVLVEQPGLWWRSSLNELDSVHRMQWEVLRDRVPRPPSEYATRNVRIGASFLAGFEAEEAVREGYADLILWGSDYPHMEGTFQHRDLGGQERDKAERSVTRLALRATCSTLEPADMRRILGGNAMATFGLDEAALAAVAQRISAPSAAELARPLEAPPPDAGLLAFRTFGPWA